jgi:exosortase
MSLKGNDLAWGITLGACWVWVCAQLSLTWSAYPNYQFGYCVPWIALFLVWRRIGEDPECLQPASPGRGAARLLPGAALVLAWGLFFFVELVREIDSNWRMVSWVMMASVTLLTGAALWLRGGGRLVKHLAFPLAFAWTALPWPLSLEDAVTLKLRAFVTSATVSALHLLGVNAWRQGNIIELASGSVAIDSACSGITSLQSTLMASLFLGEFFRFTVAWRIFLLVAGASMAVAANLARATTLVWLANRGGPNALEAYHDLAGYAETVGIFLALAAVAWLLSRTRRTRSAARAASHRECDAPMGLRAGHEGFAALAAFAAIPFLAWAWFALSPGGAIRAQETPRWKLQAVPEGRDWRAQPTSLSETDLRALNCTEEQTLSLTGRATAAVYHFFWKTNASAVFHTPENCMPGAGWRQKGDPASVSLRIKEEEFPGTLYRFARNGEEIVAIQSIWYGGDPLHSLDDFPFTIDAPRLSRLALLLGGPRRRGLESLSVYLPPGRDAAADILMAEEVLSQVLVPNR